MDPSLLCKMFFSLGTAVDLGGTLIPSFRAKIMNYGSRGTITKTPPKDQPKSIFATLFDTIASVQVPHTWFIHYYVASVLSSIFWAHQIYTHGPAFEFLAFYSSERDTSMTVNQVFLAWLFMAIQGSRRLCECITLTKPSKSKMWVGLWLIGLGYYIAMGISVWIEGVAVLEESGSLTELLEFSIPSIKTSVALPVFTLASGIQNDCHRHLAGLKKYTLPTHGLFRWIVCPHYTSECFIYIAICILTAPEGQLLNRSVLAGLGFVVTNLGVTADSTRKWYIEKFGAEKVAGRWRMFPYLF